jgi:hypothetical protein
MAERYGFANDLKYNYLLQKKWFINKPFDEQVKVLIETRETNMKEINKLLIEIVTDLKRIEDKIIIIFKREKASSNFTLQTLSDQSEVTKHWGYFHEQLHTDIYTILWRNGLSRFRLF